MDYQKRKEEMKEFQDAKKKNPELMYRDWYMNKIGNPEPTNVIHIEGIGTAKTYGEFPMERFIKKFIEVYNRKI
jgi:hypothetical protein